MPEFLPCLGGPVFQNHPPVRSRVHWETSLKKSNKFIWTCLLIDAVIIPLLWLLLLLLFRVDDDAFPSHPRLLFSRPDRLTTIINNNNNTNIISVIGIVYCAARFRPRDVVLLLLRRAANTCAPANSRKQYNVVIHVSANTWPVAHYYNVCIVHARSLNTPRYDILLYKHVRPFPENRWTDIFSYIYIYIFIADFRSSYYTQRFRKKSLRYEKLTNISFSLNSGKTFPSNTLECVTKEFGTLDTVSEKTERVIRMPCTLWVSGWKYEIKSLPQ